MRTQSFIFESWSARKRLAQARKRLNLRPRSHLIIHYNTLLCYLTLQSTTDFYLSRAVSDASGTLAFAKILNLLILPYINYDPILSPKPFLIPKYQIINYKV